MNQKLNFLGIIAALVTSASADIAIDWVTVGNVNNPNVDMGGRIIGAVDHEYKIGKYEVTNAQYGEFLNAKGQSNANGIYNADMASYGITQTGTSGQYNYIVDEALANRPVAYVSWFDAARFSNWLANGQGSGSMETGSYTLNDMTTGDVGVTVNPGATVYLPTESEWFKAGHYNPSIGYYYQYPIGSNSITTADANFDNSVGHTTDVGSYSATSYYGTYDQAGNVWEWNGTTANSRQMARGGSFQSTAASLQLIGQYIYYTRAENEGIKPEIRS